jgi:hypothetical protein
MKLVALILSLFLAGCASMAPSEKSAASAALFDIGTTAIGGYRGCQETNPLFGSEIDAQMIMTSLALTAGVHYALHRWGKGKWTWTYTGLRGAAGLHNLTVLGECDG